MDNLFFPEDGYNSEENSESSTQNDTQSNMQNDSDIDFSEDKATSEKSDDGKDYGENGDIDKGESEEATEGDEPENQDNFSESEEKSEHVEGEDAEASHDAFDDIDDNAYEVSFDSESGTYEFTAPESEEPSADADKSEEPFHNANYQSKGKGISLVTILSVCSIILSITTLIVLIPMIANITSFLNSDLHTPAVTTQQDYTKITDNNGNNMVWVNPEDLNTGDAIANATAKTINSAVVIECFYLSSTDTLSKPDSMGSGVIWGEKNKSTYIVTCNHVVENMETIRVVLNNGDSHYAEIVGTDLKTDLAVLKISASGLPGIALPAEGSSLKLGQQVIAIGNPLGSLSNTVTCGIISALERSISIEGVTMQLLQMDASVNSGNSGGGLFDLQGQLVGIVNAKTIDTGVEGIGFAIPFTTVQKICGEIIEKGYVTGRPSIGIKVYTITASNYASVFEQEPSLKDYAMKKQGSRLSVIPGIYITDTEGVKGYAEGSTSLLYGDRISSIDGDTISSLSDLSAILTSYSAGEIIEITVVRGDRSVVVQVILGQAGVN